MDHQPFPYIWLDATCVYVREHGQVVSKAVVIATGVRADGHREVLGVDIGNSENETFWTEFLRDLVDRGLNGVQLVISDAHAGLRAAIRRVLQGSGWQRCRVHAKRNLLAVANHSQRQLISALISTISAQPRRRCRSIERLKPKLKCRTDVMQIFPDPESVIRLVGALLVEVNEELIAVRGATWPPSPSSPSSTAPTLQIPSIPAVTN